MRAKYDFSNSKKSPYIQKLKQQITIKLDKETVSYFKSLAEETGLSYQNLINLYLADCAKKQKKLSYTFQ